MKSLHGESHDTYTSEYIFYDTKWLNKGKERLSYENKAKYPKKGMFYVQERDSHDQRGCLESCYPLGLSWKICLHRLFSIEGSKMRCVLCKGKIKKDPITGWSKGNNAYPLKVGRCCDACNLIFVKQKLKGGKNNG